MRFLVLLSMLLAACNIGVDPSGSYGNYQTIEQFLPQLTPGVTTRQELVAALGQPSSESRGTQWHTMMFAERTPFWESGGVGQVLTGRQEVRTLMVFLENDVVRDYQLQGTWTRRE